MPLLTSSTVTDMPEAATRQNESATRPYLPGSEGIWTFVLIDMAVFLMIFFVFVLERLKHLDLYTAGQRQLNEAFGLVNALILLTSSWMVAEAVHAARGNRASEVARRLDLALLAAGAFAASKIVEYHDKFAAGVTPTSSSFFSFYFFITLVHFLHVLAGAIFLFHFRRTARSGNGSSVYLRGIENIGVYWHLVDVLWVFIFPLLYLVGRN